MRSRTSTRSLAERGADRFEMASGSEFLTAAFLLLLLLGFKILNMLCYRFDTDESQHLHVIWGWANGFVQYRDLCDNHMPLFQLVFAPIYNLIGERADILYWMRFILLPIYFLTAWCTYKLGALCFSKRAGIWAVLLAGFFPGYHFCSLEFRTDNAWAPIWLLSLVVLLNGALTVRRSIIAGLLLGLCFGISMKTTLLLISLLVSGAITLRFVELSRLGLSERELALCLGAFLLSAAVVPGAIMAAFATAGLWREFKYWVFENNIVPGLMNHPAWWVFVFPIVFPVVVYAGWRIIRGTSDPVRAFRRGFIFLLCGFYLPALWSFWSLVSRQDYLVYHPLAFTLYAGAILALAQSLVRRKSAPQPARVVPILAAMVLLEFFFGLRIHPFWINGAARGADLLASILKLTEPGDFVLDEKGETVFRQRSFAPIWEPCVYTRIQRGWMIDDAAERCLATRTCVAVPGKDITVDATRFMHRTYLSVGHRLRVAGTWLRPSPEDAKHSDFEIVIPASYQIVARAGAVGGQLDGEPYTGARFLAPGHHSFVQTSDELGLAALWSQAAERNFTPFNYSHPAPDS